MTFSTKNIFIYFQYFHLTTKLSNLELIKSNAYLDFQSLSKMKWIKNVCSFNKTIETVWIQVYYSIKCSSAARNTCVQQLTFLWPLITKNI